MTSFVGSSSARQSIGLPGHCDPCAESGHVRAHPNLGCGDVGCTSTHPVEPYRGDRRAQHPIDGPELVTAAGIVVNDLGEPVGGHPALRRDAPLLRALNEVQTDRESLACLAEFRFTFAVHGAPDEVRAALDTRLGELVRTSVDHADAIRRGAARLDATRDEWGVQVAKRRGYRGERDQLVDLPDAPDSAYEDVTP